MTLPNEQHQLLLDLLPHVRNGEVTLQTFTGLRRGIIENIVIYSRLGSFFLKFSESSATVDGLSVNVCEIVDWQIDGVRL